MSYPNVWAMTEDQAMQYWAHRRRGDEIEAARFLHARVIVGRLQLDVPLYEIGLLRRVRPIVEAIDWDPEHWLGPITKRCPVGDPDCPYLTDRTDPCGSVACWGEGPVPL